MPKGRLKSEAVADAEDLTVEMLEIFEAVSSAQISLISSKPQLLQRLYETAKSANTKESIWQLLPLNSQELFAVVGSLPERTLRQSVARVAGWLPEVKTANPTRTGRGPGYWRWYESRRGAAAEVADLIRELLADDPSQLPDWAGGDS